MPVGRIAECRWEPWPRVTLRAEPRGGPKKPMDKKPLDERLADEARFIKTWFENPVGTGAVSPSGRFLARAMAQAVDPERPGPIVELGPGTGPVTCATTADGSRGWDRRIASRCGWISPVAAR